MKLKILVPFTSLFFTDILSKNTACYDDFESCEFFSDLGLCSREEVRAACKLSCKECGNELEELSLTLKSGFGFDCGRCQDEDPIFCNAFKHQLNSECKKAHVQEKCERSCNLCQPDVSCPKFEPYGSQPPQSYWGDWSLWTKCTKKCGMGVQFRRKKCIKDDNTNECDKTIPFTQIRPCMTKQCENGGKSSVRKLENRRDYYNCCDSVSIRSAVIDSEKFESEKLMENVFGVYKKVQGKTFNKRAVYKKGGKFLYCQPSRTQQNLKMWIVSDELGAHNGDLIVEFESDAACPSDSPIGLWSHNIDPTSDWKQDTSITVKCNDDCVDRPMCIQFANNDNACMDLMVMNQCPILCGTCQPY